MSTVRLARAADQLRDKHLIDRYCGQQLQSSINAAGRHLSAAQYNDTVNVTASQPGCLKRVRQIINKAAASGVAFLISEGASAV